MFITVEELKQTVLNANIDAEYIQPAIGEAEDVYLREILGDALYNELASQINDNALVGNYATLVNSYIKPYLTYKVQSILVVPINFKMRNAGVISQYDQGFTTSNVKDTAYLADHYNSRAEFYANRLTTYLQQNNADFPEYGYSDENVTNPVTSQNTTTLYLGGTRKKCNCNGRSGGGSGSSVDWNDIRNKPDFANVATSGDYEDLTNKPNIPESPVQSDWNETDTNSLAYIQNKPSIPAAQIQSDWNQTNSQAVDYIKNKPTKVSDFTNDAGYLTEHQDLTGYATEQWVSNQGYSTFSGLYNDLSGKPNLATVATSGDYNDLQNKPNIPTVNNATLTIKQGGTTKGTFTANAGTDVEINLESGGSGGSTDWSDITNKPNFATVATSGDYNDLTNKPTIPAAQVNSDWNANSGVAEILNKPSLATVATSGNYSDLNGTPSLATVATSGDYDDLQNKPTIPVVPTNVSAFTNDAGYTTFDGDYNSLTNKPTIPAAQVNSDWNASTGVSQILNKPSLATVATSGDYDDLQNKPTIPAAQVNADWNSNSGVSQILNKPSLATVATSGNYNDLNGTPTLATVATSGDYDDLQNKPTIPAAPVQSDWNEADSSSLAYIANKPTIPAAQVNSDWNAVSGVAQILNKPTIPTVPAMATETLTFTLQGGTTKTIDFYTVPDYFYVENRTNSNGTFTIKKSAAGAPSIQVYSSTDRINWTNMGTTSTSGITISMPANGKTYLKATANNWGDAQLNYNYINTNYNCNVGGNIMSLLYGDSFVNKTTFPTNNTYVLARLFANNTHIISAENLILPANTLKNYCYSNMFSGCSSLTTAPTILPATTLAEACYSGMFSGCRALTTAPVLPATTLVSFCYNNMFYQCIALTTAPVLPATTLASNCYQEMFNVCSSLNNITIYANNISASNCLKYWVNGVAAQGDFYRLGSASFPSGISGIPSGWTTHTSL